MALTEQEQKAIEQAIDDLARTISSLRSEITETELRISTLQNTMAALTRLLPTDKRIDRLFS
jgi:prefoldin subunit 5